MNLVPSAAAPDLISPAVAANPAPISIPVKSANLVFSAVAPFLIDVTVSLNLVDNVVPRVAIVPRGSFAKPRIPLTVPETRVLYPSQPAFAFSPIKSIPEDIVS